MRTIPYPYGEHLAGATQSFGHISRSAAADVVCVTPLRIASIDVGMVRPPVAAAMPSSFELHAAARAERARQMRDLIVGALRWLAGQVAHYTERRRQRAIAHATYRTLRELDSRTLRDLGLDHSEVLSFALSIGRDHPSDLRAARVANGLRLF